MLIMGKKRIKTISNPEPYYRANYSNDPEWKACTSKTTYYSIEQANSIALNIRANGQDKNIYPYSCQYCDNWHIGHHFE